MFAESCLCAHISGWSLHWHCMLHQFVGHHLSWHWTERWVTVWSTVAGRHRQHLSPGPGWTIFLQAMPDTPDTQWFLNPSFLWCSDMRSAILLSGSLYWGHPARSPLTCWSPALKPREEVWAVACELAPLSVNQLLVAPNLGRPPWSLFHPLLNMPLPHSPATDIPGVLCYYFLLQSGPLSADSSIIFIPPKAFKYALNSAI